MLQFVTASEAGEYRVRILANAELAALRIRTSINESILHVLRTLFFRLDLPVLAIVTMASVVSTISAAILFRLPIPTLPTASWGDALPTRFSFLWQVASCIAAGGLLGRRELHSAY